MIIIIINYSSTSHTSPLLLPPLLSFPLTPLLSSLLLSIFTGPPNLPHAYTLLRDKLLRLHPSLESDGWTLTSCHAGTELCLFVCLSVFLCLHDCLSVYLTLSLSDCLYVCLLIIVYGWTPTPPHPHLMSCSDPSRTSTHPIR